MKDYITFLWANNNPLAGYAKFVQTSNWSEDYRIKLTGNVYEAFQGNVPQIPKECLREMQKDFHPVAIRVVQTITFINPEESDNV